MARVLVTGGTGRLGRELVPRLVRSGHAVTVLSRRSSETGDGASSVVGDLLTGSGLHEAVAGAEFIVHAASSAFAHARATEVDGTRRLVEAAKAAGTPHLCYVSIVGVDRPLNAYYRAKRDAEQVVAAAGVPHTILRATQFHEFVAEMLERLARTPVLPVVAGATMQPVDTGEVADALVALAHAGPQGRTDDVGGPEVRTMADLAKAWLRVRGKRAWVLPVPALGAALQSLKAGVLTNPGRKVGRVTWEQHLARAFGSGG